MNIDPFPNNTMVRIITSPYARFSHLNIAQCGGNTTELSGSTDDCPFCSDDIIPQRRWIIGMIDRCLSQYMVYELDSELFSSICRFVKNPDYGNPIKYDLEVMKIDNGYGSSMWHILPQQPSPLSEKDLEIERLIDKDWFKAQCAPSSKEEMSKAYDRWKNKLEALQ